MGKFCQKKKKHAERNNKCDKLHSLARIMVQYLRTTDLFNIAKYFGSSWQQPQQTNFEFSNTLKCDESEMDGTGWWTHLLVRPCQSGVWWAFTLSW